ncbi:MAG: PilW family protein [Desulfobacteraceae bacterium]
MSDYMSKSRQRIVGNLFGFTLVELLIVMAVSSVVLIGVTNFITQTMQNSAQQIATSKLQQNQRGALAIMEKELRKIGMDRKLSNNFHITDVRRYSIVGPADTAVPDENGSPVLRMQVDLNDDGRLGSNETITYSLYDKNGDGQPPWELGRSTTMPGSDAITNLQMLAEGVEASGLAFAYAFDADGDGMIDRGTAVAGEPIIWAMDSDNDGTLDTDINGNDIDDVPLEKIKGVRFWLLGRTQHEDLKHLNNRQYAVGDQLIGPFNDHFRRWLLSEIIHCRNL